MRSCKGFSSFFFFPVSILHMESQVQNNNKNLNEAFQRNTLNVTKTMQDFILHIPRESENVQNLDLDKYSDK